MTNFIFWKFQRIFVLIGSFCSIISCIWVSLMPLYSLISKKGIASTWSDILLILWILSIINILWLNQDRVHIHNLFSMYSLKPSFVLKLDSLNWVIIIMFYVSSAVLVVLMLKMLFSEQNIVKPIIATSNYVLVWCSLSICQTVFVKWSYQKK